MSYAGLLLRFCLAGDYPGAEGGTWGMTLFLKMKRSRSSESSGAAITGTAAAVATEAGSSSPSPAKRVKLDARTQNQLDLITSVPVIRDYKRRAGGRRGSVFVTQDMLIDTLGGQVGAQLGLAAKAKGGEGASSSTTGGGDASSDEEEKDVRPPAAAFSLTAATFKAAPLKAMDADDGGGDDAASGAASDAVSDAT